MNMSWRGHILLVTVSAALIWPIGHLLDWLDTTELPKCWWTYDYLIPGAIFGALVLAPFISTTRYRVFRAIVLVLGSTFIWALSTKLAAYQYGPLNLSYDISITVSGGLGAILVGVLLKFVAPLQTSNRYWIYLPIAGLFGGFLFELVWDSSYLVLAMLGYLGWQVSVCLALYFGMATNNRGVTANY